MILLRFVCVRESICILDRFTDLCALSRQNKTKLKQFSLCESDVVPLCILPFTMCGKWNKFGVCAIPLKPMCVAKKPKWKKSIYRHIEIGGREKKSM